MIKYSEKVSIWQIWTEMSSQKPFASWNFILELKFQFLSYFPIFYVNTCLFQTNFQTPQFMHGIVAILAYKLYKACKDLRIVSGRRLTEFSAGDQILMKRCLHMSNIAYVNLSKDSCLTINEKDFVIFRDNDGLLYPQAKIPLDRIIARVKKSAKSDQYV